MLESWGSLGPVGGQAGQAGPMGDDHISLSLAWCYSTVKGVETITDNGTVDLWLWSVCN